ncbi:MAG: rhodanese-like domain-containing protein [Spirochaetales bacterium]|nr:rhodanese-like domain-containing protein [Spirochaetales bacterium]
MKRFLSLFFVALLIPFTVLTGCAEKEKAAETTATAVAQVNPVEEAALAYFADYPGSRIVPATTVFEKMDAGEDIFILDIRKAEDYAAGHLKGAVNAAWGTPALAESLNWLPDDVPLFVNCYSGQTAGQTVAVLNVAGFKASSIKYGWKLGITQAEGYEAYTESTVNPAPVESGVKIDAEIKSAAADYFNNLKADPETPSNIIAASKLKEKLDADEEMTIVSIRKPEDFSAGHVESAINIPFGAGMEAQFADLPQDEKVFVYCYSGQTAGQTVAIMRLLGIDAASVKSGFGTSGTGTTGWNNEGLPIVK